MPDKRDSHLHICSYTSRSRYIKIPINQDPYTSRYAHRHMRKCETLLSDPVRACVCARAFLRTRMRGSVYICWVYVQLLLQMCVHVCVCVHVVCVCTCMCVCVIMRERHAPHTQTLSLSHTHTHAHTHTHTHKHIHTHAHTYTRTLTQHPTLLPQNLFACLSTPFEF